MISQYSTELAQRMNVSAHLGIADDLDYDLAVARVKVDKVIRSPYFAEWDFDLPGSGSDYFDDLDVPPLAS
jgi:hypothetical protein